MKNISKQSEEKVYSVNDVDSILERVDDSFKIMTESMDIKFENVNQRFDAIDKRFDGIDNRLELVETKIDRLQDDMVEVKFELKQKVSVDQFQRLERRVTKLERLSLSHQS